MATSLNTILKVNLVTPRGVVAHTDADSVQAPGELGEFELLPGHIPLLTALKPGVLTIGTKARARYAVGGGYLRVDPNGEVEILEGKCDDLPEQAFEMTGTIDDVRAAAAEMAKKSN